MNKKTLPIFILVVFIAISAIGAYLFIRLTKQEASLAPEPGDTEIERIAHAPGDPIKKFVPPEGGEIIYEIEGVLLESLVRRNVLLRGEMVVKGDPLERRISIVVGAIDGTTPFGTYEGSFDATSTWTKTPVSEVAGEIEAGEPVIIRTRLSITGRGEEDRSSREKEKLIDGLIREFRSDDFNMQLPDDFVLVATRIGVIR